MQKCPRCGTENKKRKLCSRCGAALVSKDHSVDAGWASGGGLRYRYNPAKSSGQRMNLRVFGAILAIVITTGLIFVSFGNVTGTTGGIAGLLFGGLEKTINGMVPNLFQSSQSGTDHCCVFELYRRTAYEQRVRRLL